MLPLAQWLLRGQGQALAFVTICFSAGCVFWPVNILAVAGLALLTLRLGATKSATIGLLALIPASTIGYQLGSAFMPVLLGLSTLLVSETLRASRSWALSLLALTISAFIASSVMLLLFEAVLLEQVAFMQDILQQLQAPMSNGNPTGNAALMSLLTDSLNSRFMAGIWGSMVSMMCFFGIVLSRSWQAKLFNPGGFQREFHELRLGKIDTFLYTLTGLGFLTIDTSMMTWAWICMFPLLISGLAFCHWFGMQKKLKQHWYVIFYLLLILNDFLRLILVLIALLDVSINLRARLNKQNTFEK